MQNETSLRQEAFRDFFRGGSWPSASPVLAVGRMVVTGPGVACPKSWRSGCEPAALETEPFPFCPPGPAVTVMVLRLASATRWAKMASLMRLFRQRKASLLVLPSLTLRS